MNGPNRGFEPAQHRQSQNAEVGGASVNQVQMEHISALEVGLKRQNKTTWTKEPLQGKQLIESPGSGIKKPK